MPCARTRPDKKEANAFLGALRQSPPRQERSQRLPWCLAPEPAPTRKKPTSSLMPCARARPDKKEANAFLGALRQSPPRQERSQRLHWCLAPEPAPTRKKPTPSLVPCARARPDKKEANAFLGALRQSPPRQERSQRLHWCLAPEPAPTRKKPTPSLVPCARAHPDKKEANAFLGALRQSPPRQERSQRLPWCLAPEPTPTRKKPTPSLVPCARARPDKKEANAFLGALRQSPPRQERSQRLHWCLAPEPAPTRKKPTPSLVPCARARPDKKEANAFIGALRQSPPHKEEAHVKDNNGDSPSFCKNPHRHDLVIPGLG